jgi:LuxR family maltose regulon positive regulatory protein
VVFTANHRNSSPAAPRLIERGELLASLDRAAEAKVTLVSAPAGSGKTSLLRAWADGPGQRYRLAVVQVQRDQQDSQQFWIAVLRAVRQAHGTAGESGQPAATPDFSQGAVADRVRAELAEHSDRTFLVIDDLHELTSPDALAQLTRLLEELPPQVHAILATRRSMPLRLHRLRLAGELAEVRTAELRFTERETRELLAASGIALSEAGAAMLHRRTEGWAAGLRLAAISLAGSPDPERFVAEFSGSSRTVAEYLLAEMLECQPAAVQQLLLRTSLLDRVNGELADLLTGHPGSEGVLLDLEDANAFVVSLDPARTWFRYHHLFADMLRLELRRTLPEELPVLHRRAAGWLSEHGEILDAIRHTQAAGDWPDAARLLADHSFGLTLDGQAQTIQALLRAFPPGAVTDGPDIPLARATNDVARGRLDEAAAHLSVAEASIAATPAERRHRLEVATAALRLSLARKRGHLAAVVDQVRFLATPVTGQSDEDIALDSDLRAVALMNLGIVEAWSLGNQDSQRHLQAGADLARRIGRPYLEVGCLAELGFAAKIEPFATTRQRCREAIALAEQHGWGAEPVISPALVNLAGALIWTGHFDEGDHWLRRTARALETDTGPLIRLVLHMGTGMLFAGRQLSRQALAEYRAAEDLQAQLAGPHALARQLTSWRLAAQARTGQLSEARASLEALDDGLAGSGEIGNARAAICLAEGNPAGALAAARDVLDGAAPVIGYVTVVEANLMAALAHRELGDQRAATAATESALALSEADRLVLPFAVTGSLTLLEAVPRHETAHAALLTDITEIIRGSSPTPGNEPSQPGAERLSPSELRVLRYLPTNLSRLEIARELSVSVNTVNTHVRNIYAKLQAQDRSAAVQRARQLRLLSAGPSRWLRYGRQRSHPPAQERGELIRRPRAVFRRNGRPEQGLAVRTAVRIGDHEPGLGEQPGGQLGFQAGAVPDGARQVPAMGELLHRGQVAQHSPGELAEWQPDRLVQHAISGESRDGDPGALLVGGNEVPGRVVSVGGRLLPGDHGGPPARRADEMVDQRADIPGRTGRGGGQVIGPDLRQDDQGALQSLAQRAVTHARSSRLTSACTQADQPRTGKESAGTPLDG